MIIHNLLRLPADGNVSGSTSDDPCNQQGEPKKNRCACDDSKNEDLFRMVESKSATKNLYVAYREAVFHRYIYPENYSRNYQYKSDDDHGFLQSLGSQVV